MSKHLEFYRLERPAFEDGVRDAAAVGTRPLRAALERVRRLLEAGTGTLCVHGRSGVGKTYFGLALPSVLSSDTLLARLGTPGAAWSSHESAIAKGFGLDPQSFSLDALRKLRDAGKRLVIELDPLEDMDAEALVSLRSLLGCAYLPETRLVQAVLIANLPALPPASRETLDALGAKLLELEPLPEGDLPSYLQKRLDRAGFRGQPLFSREAADEIRRRAEGIPREINRICTLTLDLGAERRVEHLGAEHVREACGEPPLTAVAPGTPKAVLGRLKLKTRPIASAGVARGPRIEALPPEPVVEAELETPLMEPEYVDDSPLPAVRPVTVQAAPAPAAPLPEPAPALHATEPDPVPAPAPPEAPPVGPTSMAPVPVPPDPTPIASPLMSRVQTSAQAPVVAPPPERRAAKDVEPAPETPTAAALPPSRRFPWIHVGASLAAAWLLAAGAVWLHARSRAPETPSLAIATPAAPPSIPAAIEAPSAELLTTIQMVSATPYEAIAGPASSAAPSPAAASSSAAPVSASAPEPAAGTAPIAAHDPAPDLQSDPPTRTAQDSPPRATSPQDPPAPAALAPSAPSERRPAKTQTATATPAQPPLRVELRARGREILYPPRPASAYEMPVP